MKSHKGAVVPLKKPMRRPPHTPAPNAMHFPQALRDAIPGPDLPGCDRLLILSSIAGSWSHSIVHGRRVQLNLRVEESGKLTGVFDVKVHLNVDAARALADTLEKLIEHDGNAGAPT